tara:strand:- start:117 stop:587 length:471 start_codon:yes stop_codon:yes gene_type:complete
MDTLDESVKPLIQAFLAQMDSAMRVSEVLANHNSPNKEITADHIIGGLVFRLMVPMTNEELDQSLSSAKQIMDKLDQTDSEESEESDEDYDEIQECYPIESRKESRRVKYPHCNCDICSKVRICILNYHQHECTDPLADKFRNAINHTCEQHKLLL